MKNKMTVIVCAFLVSACSSQLLPYKEKSSDTVKFHGKLVSPIDAYKEAIGKDVAQGALVTPKGMSEEEYYNRLLKRKMIKPMNRRYSTYKDSSAEKYQQRYLKDKYRPVKKGWSQTAPSGTSQTTRHSVIKKPIKKKVAQMPYKQVPAKKNPQKKQKTVHKNQKTRAYYTAKYLADKRKQKAKQNQLRKKQIAQKNNKKPLSDADLLRAYQQYVEKIPTKKPINRTLKEVKTEATPYFAKPEIAHYDKVFFFIPDGEKVSIQQVNINIPTPRPARPLPPTRLLDIRQ